MLRVQGFLSVRSHKPARLLGQCRRFVAPQRLGILRYPLRRGILLHARHSHHPRIPITSWIPCLLHWDHRGRTNISNTCRERRWRSSQWRSGSGAKRGECCRGVRKRRGCGRWWLVLLLVCQQCAEVLFLCIFWFCDGSLLVIHIQVLQVKQRLVLIPNILLVLGGLKRFKSIPFWFSMWLERCGSSHRGLAAG